MLKTGCFNILGLARWKAGIPMSLQSFHTSSPWSSLDYYRVLGVPRNATSKDIKNAYFKLAKQYHPDSNAGDKGAAERFQEISQAYEILGNKENKENYDMFGSNTYNTQSSQQRHSQGHPFGNQQQWTYQQMNAKEAEKIFEHVFKNFSQHPSSSKGGGGFINSMMSSALKGLGKSLLEEMMKSNKTSTRHSNFEIKMGPNGIEFVKKSKK